VAIALSIGQLEGWVAQGFFPFTRIGACLMVAPVFGARFVPPRTRIILAVAITALLSDPSHSQPSTLCYQRLANIEPWRDVVNLGPQAECTRGRTACRI